MKSKIIFVSDPDFVLGASIGIKNFKDKHVREFLNLCEKTLAIYLVDQTSSKEWLDKIQKQNIIIYDCSQMSVDKILKHGQ